MSFTASTDATQMSPSVVRFSTLMALTIASMIIVFPPVLHFYYGTQFENETAESEAKLRAKSISQLVGRNPTLWEFETLRIQELIEVRTPGQKIVVENAEGESVAQSGPDKVPLPLVIRTHPIHDAGRDVGKITITHSVAKTAKTSASILLLSMMVGLIAFFFLRTFPLKLLRRASERASFLASHDPLTRLPNRSLFNESLVQSIADVDRQNSSLAVLCLDLDHFKEVNDILGHSAGDDLLKQVTERMTSSLRSNDILARLGGDEFAIVQKHVEQPAGSSALAERLIEAIAKPFDLDGSEVFVGTSIGISILGDSDERDGQVMLRHADLAMYRAKSDGRGTFRYFQEEMNDALIARKERENALRKALLDNEFELVYQPQIDLASNAITGVEALLRWNHATEGQILPEDFIQLAEETSLIVPIGEWVIRQACHDARNWPELTVAINVSPVQFRQGNLVETVRSAVEAEGIDPTRLEIEITEGILLTNTEETIAVLTNLQKLGVKIAMDDFGTGYSSLSYLRRFPFDKIKIDRSFTKDLGSSSEADNIIDAVIKLGASMGMISNAEGVETMEQANFLRSHGCMEVQGFHFSKPVPSADISELMSDREWRKFDDGNLVRFNPETIKSA
jgi:diguanylate cyclase (GGDEF)-like protein